MDKLNIELSYPLIYTHSNSFHVDELAAIALLSRYWFNLPVADLSIIRTRDPETLKMAKESLFLFASDMKSFLFSKIVFLNKYFLRSDQLLLVSTMSRSFMLSLSTTL